MNFRVKILSVFIPLSLFLCFMSNTYSRYVADTTGDLKMSFAQWQILVNTEDITNSFTSSIDLTPVIDKNKYVEDNKIAPASTGYFDISIDPTNVDVAFNYSISLNVINENIPDLIITKYAILDGDYNETGVINYQNIENNLIKGSLDFEDVATDSDELQEHSFEPFIVRICFEWYEGENQTMGDDADTLVGVNASETDLEINAQIKFEQKLDENEE